MPVVSTFGALSSRGFGGIGGSSSPIYSFLGMLGSGTPAKIVADSNGDLIVLDISGNNVTKISIAPGTFGNTLWSKSLSYKTFGLAIDSSNNVYLGGSTQVTGIDNGTAKVMKLDSNGNLLWTNTYSGFRVIVNIIFGTSYSEVNQISINSSDTIYIGDSFYYANIDSNGDVLSSRRGSYPLSTSTNNIYVGPNVSFVDRDIEYINTSTNVATAYTVATTGLVNRSGTIYIRTTEPGYNKTVTNTDSLIISYQVGWTYDSGPVQPNFIGYSIQKLDNTYLKAWVSSATDTYTTPVCIVDSDGTVYFTTLKIVSGTATDLYIGALSSTGTQLWLNRIYRSVGSINSATTMYIKGDNLYLNSVSMFLIVPKNGGIYGAGLFTLPGSTYSYTNNSTTLPYTSDSVGWGVGAGGTSTPDARTNNDSAFSQTISDTTSPYIIAVST